MNALIPLVFDPVRLAKYFSALQPVADPVQSIHSAAPACCLQTKLRLHGAGSDGRSYWLTLPLQSALPNETPDEPGANRLLHVMGTELPSPVIQMLAGGANQSRLVVHATGPAECPPGRANEVRIDSPGGESVSKQIPFEGWSIPLQVSLDFDGLCASPERLVALLHPCNLPSLPPAVLRVDAPACHPIKLQAMVAIFPDVRWDGELTVRTEPDASAQKGFQIKVESTVVCAYGGAEWKLDLWEHALALCPWLECVPMLAKTLAAIDGLRQDARTQGFDNPRLVKGGALTWSQWPQCRLGIRSALREQAEHGLLGHTFHLGIAADPLVAGAGEKSLLPDWLENPLWRARLAPLLAGVASGHASEVTQEIGLWLVVDGRMGLRIQRHQDRPEVESRIQGESRGGISLDIEGRSAREYETIIVRAGAAERMNEPAVMGITCCASDPASPVAPGESPLLGRVAFSGLAIWGLEKQRPGIRIRRRKIPPREAAPQPAAPLAVLLTSRVWPSEAADGPVPIPWSAS